MRILLPDDNGVEQIYEMSAVNHREGTFSAEPFVKLQLPLRIKMSMATDYKPYPDRKNFERALEEWDYYYMQSDDPRVHDAGIEQRQALFQMFKQLTPQEQLHYKKIADILNSSL